MPKAVTSPASRSAPGLVSRRINAVRRGAVLIALALVVTGAGEALAESGPDLSQTVPILEEDFSEGLRRYDGRTGIWSLLPRGAKLMTNAEETVFIGPGALDPETEALLPKVHEVTPEGLALRTQALPETVLPAVRAYMKRTGQGQYAADVLYGAGRIATDQTWAQTYGYFEIEARIPRGRGRWPGFWLTSAGKSWPPEIDIFEAYGKGIDAPTKKDDTFNTAVMFDALDAEGEPGRSVAITNPHDPVDENPKVKVRSGRNIYTFSRLMKARSELNADIYADFNTYAALWTPTTISFYFGPDPEHLREIYRTPTPEDLNDPMYLIVNDLFTARGGWWPKLESELDEVLDPANALMVRRIEMRALAPSLELRMTEGALPFAPVGSRIFDTPGDDVIAPGGGFDIIALSGGADRISIARGRDSKILSGFGADDQLTLTGFGFADGAEVLARLTQVGADVWLPSGAKPLWPQSVIFRDSRLSDFRAAQFILP